MSNRSGYKLRCANTGFPLFSLWSRTSVITCAGIFCAISWPPLTQHLFDVSVFSLSLYQGCIYPVIPNKRAGCGRLAGVRLFLARATVLSWLFHKQPAIYILETEFLSSLFSVWPVLVFWLWRHTSVCPAVCSRCPCDVSTVTFGHLWFNFGPTIANAGTSLAHYCAAISSLIYMLARCWPIGYDAGPTLRQHLLNVCMLDGRWLDNI